MGAVAYHMAIELEHIFDQDMREVEYGEAYINLIHLLQGIGGKRKNTTKFYYEKNDCTKRKLFFRKDTQYNLLRYLGHA